MAAPAIVKQKASEFVSVYHGHNQVKSARIHGTHDLIKHGVLVACFHLQKTFTCPRNRPDLISYKELLSMPARQCKPATRNSSHLLLHWKDTLDD